MPTLVQVEVNPEYLKFPSRCVCCGRPDERNMEMAVSSTDPDERTDNIIMEIEVPYCLECYDHAQARSTLWRTVAVAVALSLISFSSMGVVAHLSGVIALIAIVLFAGYLLWEWNNNRKLMRPSCSAKKNHVTFGHPTNTRISTIFFTNIIVADSFKDRNRYNLVER
jgi:hypothetical protein